MDELPGLVFPLAWLVAVHDMLLKLVFSAVGVGTLATAYKK